MSTKTTYTNISKLYTLQGGIRTKAALDDPKIIEEAYLTVEDEILVDLGKMSDYHPDHETNIIDCKGQIVCPGFIDAHSHLVFAGDRTNEYAMKIKGASYLDIYQAGGGIHATVKATQEASFDELLEKAKMTLNEFLACGVTTLEAKSGYGLNHETELKQLRVIQQLKQETPIELVSTFMPAHALPQSYSNSKEFLDDMIQLIPTVIKENLAEYMDCFLEKGIFDAQEAQYILQAGKDAGLKIKIHIDEMEDIGGSDVAVQMQATSVEHCMVTTPENMEKLQQAQITAVILPATSFNLCKPYADVRTMIDKGMIIALSCDYNPGSSPCSDPLWMARIASRGCRLTPNEVLSMMTINAAKALDRDHLIGSLEIGKQADFILMNAHSFDEVIATMGANPITTVVKKGKRVIDVNRKEYQ